MAGAPLGNINGAKGKRWQDALNKALARFVSVDPPIAVGEALDKIALRVVEGALAGDWDSITEIANRLDGKPAQSVTVGGDEDSPLQHKHEVVFVNGPDRTAGKT